MLRKSAFDKLGCDLLHSKDPSNVAAFRWGREHEQVAFDQYSVILPQCHRNIKLCKAGFYTHQVSLVNVVRTLTLTFIPPVAIQELHLLSVTGNSLSVDGGVVW